MFTLNSLNGEVGQLEVDQLEVSRLEVGQPEVGQPKVSLARLGQLDQVESAWPSQVSSAWFDYV